MKILRWILRLPGTLLALAAVISLFVSPPEMSFSDIVHTAGQAGFFLMVAGFIVGWKWERVAGIMILLGYVVFAAVNRIVFINWILVLFPLIGIGYLVLGVLEQHTKTVLRQKKY